MTAATAMLIVAYASFALGCAAIAYRFIRLAHRIWSVLRTDHAPQGVERRGVVRASSQEVTHG